MARRGNPYDNAMMDSFLKTLKVEGAYPTALKIADDVSEHLWRIIDSYNEGRLHSTLTYLRPYRCEEEQHRNPISIAARNCPIPGSTPEDACMCQQFVKVRCIAAILLSIFIVGCSATGDISRYKGAAPPMDSGIGFNAEVKTFCTTAGLAAYKVRMHEESWRLATSGKFHFPESRVRMLFKAYATLEEYIDKGEQTHQDLKNSPRCQAVSRRTDLGYAKHPRQCTTSGLLQAKLDVYEISWRTVTGSEFRDIPEERVKLLFDADELLRRQLAELEQKHLSLKNSAKCRQ